MATKTETSIRDRVRSEVLAEREQQLEAEIDARMARQAEAAQRAEVHKRLCAVHGVPVGTSASEVARLEWTAEQRHRGEVHARHGRNADPAAYQRGSLDPIERGAA